MCRHRFILSACVFGLMAGAGCSSEPAAQAQAAPTPEDAALATQVDNTVKHQIQLQQLQRVDDRCHWLDATSRVALDITAQEQAAWVVDKASAEALDAPEVFNESQALGETSCDDQDMQVKFRYTTWQQRVTWALRAQAMLDGEGRPAWFAAQSPVLAYRDALDETVDALKEKYTASIAAFQPDFEIEAVQMLSLLCPNAPHECPFEEDELHPRESYGKAYAEVWVQSATAFAKALAQDPVKLPPMPGSEDDTSAP